MTESASDHILILLEIGREKALQTRTIIKWSKINETLESEEYRHKKINNIHELKEEVLQMKTKIYDKINKFRNK